MFLATKVAGSFDRTARERGSVYLARRKVRIRHTTGDYLEATVRGSRSYDTSLFLAGSRLIVSCTCPPFLELRVQCRHVWATVLAADQKGHLGGSPEGRVDVHTDEDFAHEAAATEDGDAGPADRAEPAAPDAFERPAQAPAAGDPPPRGWRQKLAFVRSEWERDHRPDPSVAEAGGELLYLLDPGPPGAPLRLELATRRRKQDGTWTRLRRPSLRQDSVGSLPDPADRRILAMLVGAAEAPAGEHGLAPGGEEPRLLARFDVPPVLLRQLLPELARTGRLRLLLRDRWSEPAPLVVDEGAPLELWIDVRADLPADRYRLRGSLRRGAEVVALDEVWWAGRGGFVVFGGKIALLADEAVLPWIPLLAGDGFDVPLAQGSRLVEELYRLPRLPRLELPAELRIPVERAAPAPVARINASKSAWLGLSLSFLYDGLGVAETDPAAHVFDAARRRLIVRDAAAERAAAEQLAALGVRAPAAAAGPGRRVAAHHLQQLVRKLTALGWRVEADGRLCRAAGAFRLGLTSDIDWFDLAGELTFGDQAASLPDILGALRRGEATIRLGDGTIGMLPEEWLRRYGLLAQLGAPEAGRVRFRRHQAALLDALLADRPEITFDAEFGRARDDLAHASGVTPQDAPPGFTGTLREYQREGLGWLAFLDRTGFGGCLADDMGLGKTVQVLALIEGRRGRTGRPSLVVVPRSLLFNWRDEAAKFTPQLRVLQHTGKERSADAASFAGFDLVITTYGLLRRDILALADIRFDYVILDEAQSIKNEASDSAKAARLLVADHRLAMSGTPIENDLGELWSLFEFLNPGMLGRASLFRHLGAEGGASEAEQRALLARGLRPFLLRRTKEQVATDLPGKTEQTIHCELEDAQRRIYDELREHYRRSLFDRIDRDGLARTKVHVLEALLRLRQAAIHPALIDPSHAPEGSAKLDCLIPRLAEVVERGHKALVFSQFTKMLAIVRDRLDRERVPYEYLDGQTRDRAAHVSRFQEDPDCRLFLVSLKAGGLGLNLTAADYVFILDPWWNPAAEAQAVDRAHRIGQDKHVIAYRLIARGTIEEKVVELQETKRELAAAILTEDKSLVRELTREDLELLLS